MERKSADIVIAGGGVAGLSAAAAFGAAGFTVVIIDPAPQVTDENAEGADLRTTAFLQPAQAFLDRAGVWEGLAPHATPLQVMRIVDASGPDGSTRVTADFNASDISDLPFGWNLPNWLTRRVLLDRLAGLPNVDFQSGNGFRSMLARETEILVTLTNGSQIRAQLLVGADGRHSAVREAAGITSRTTRYGQKALTFAVTHDAPHNNVSTEVHRAGGPFTLVPLPDHNGTPCSAVVWMETGAEAQRLSALPDEAFDAAITDRSAGVYGPLTLASRRMVWPIVSQIADTLIGPRTALVAEAAHVMPPIGAQGLNTSLKDLTSLLETAQSHPLGSRQMLDAYRRQRQPDIMLRAKGIDALNRASMTGSPLAQDLRVAGIKALYGVAPVRKGLMRLGLGAG
ncbi:MAG: UbiH/UbiF family hydroxylase [Pseudomonadota bacterium]